MHSPTFIQRTAMAAALAFAGTAAMADEVTERIVRNPTNVPCQLETQEDFRAGRIQVRTVHRNGTTTTVAHAGQDRPVIPVPGGSTVTLDYLDATGQNSRYFNLSEVREEGQEADEFETLTISYLLHENGTRHLGATSLFLTRFATEGPKTIVVGAKSPSFCDKVGSMAGSACAIL
jgi:hypothetical protein